MSKQVVEYSIHTLMHWRCSMTAAEFYEQSPEFRQLIAEWVRCKRCPPGLADYLHEYGLDGPANAAWWAEREPDRHYQYAKLTEGVGIGQREMTGPMPILRDGRWAWQGTRAGQLYYAYDFPGSFDLTVVGTAADAIIELLDSCRDYVFDANKDMNKGLSRYKVNG